MLSPAEPRILAPAPKVNKFKRRARRLAPPQGACHLNPGKWITCQDKSRGLGVHGKRISFLKTAGTGRSPGSSLPRPPLQGSDSAEPTGGARAASPFSRQPSGTAARPPAAAPRRAGALPVPGREGPGCERAYISARRPFRPPF